MMGVPVFVNEKQFEALEEIAKIGLWGTTPTDVAATLIEDGLRDLLRDGVLMHQLTVVKEPDRAA